MAWVTGKRGAFRVMWRIGGRGTPPKASRTFHNRADAEEEKRAIEADLAEQKAEAGSPTSRTPLPKLLKRWADSRVAQGWARKDYADTVKGLLEAMAAAQKWERVSDITSAAVDSWVIAKGGKGVRRPLQYLKGFLRWARDATGVRVDPKALAYKLGPRIARKSPDLLTDVQVARILQVALSHGPQVAALLEHIALYGCRPVDACRAKVKDYDPAARAVIYRGTKNKHDIDHPVHARHAARLDALVADRSPDEPLFLNAYHDGGWRINERGAAGHLTDWYKANVGKPLIKAKELKANQGGIYCLKDFACSRLSVATKGNIKQAMAISGHRTESAFRRYQGSNQEGQHATLDAVPLIEPASKPPPSDPVKTEA